MKKKCELGCGHLVGGGGDRHAKFACPPPFKGGASERQRRRRLEARRKARDGADVPSRGVAVAGVGGAKAKRHRTKKALA